VERLPQWRPTVINITVPGAKEFFEKETVRVGEPLAQFADDVLPGLPGERDLLLVAALIDERRPLADLLLDLSHVMGESRQPTPARLFERACALALDLQLALPDLGGAFQCFDVRLR
jgi:hypothetical protein